MLFFLGRIASDRLLRVMESDMIRRIPGQTARIMGSSRSSLLEGFLVWFCLSLASCILRVFVGTHAKTVS